MSNTGFIQHIYRRCPVFLQNILISLFGFYWKKRRYGGVFEEEKDKFLIRESFTNSQWREYQTKELQQLLIHAYKTVPFYRERYSVHGITLDHLKNFQIEDLETLPFLEKEDLRRFGESILLSEQKGKGTFLSSSGSTGTPVRIYYSNRMHQTWSAAYEARVRNWAGVNYKMSRAMIGGRRILPDSNAKPPYYRYNYSEKQLYFSAYHLSIETISNYLQGLRRYRTEYLVGYATSIYLMAQYAERKGLSAPKMKAVLTSSEKLTSEMKSVIERVFKCRCHDAYSGVESCGLISENPMGELLFSPDTGILEVLDKKGSQVKNGEIGEVVLTGLLNYDQPLIRYRIGDRLKLRNNQQSEYNVNMPVIEEIEGRLEDVITTMDGRQMSRFHSIFIDIPGLVVAQLVQKKLDEFRINLVTESSYNKDSEGIMIKRLKSQVGEIEVKFNYLEKIPVNRNGKFRAVVSEIAKM